MDNEFMRIALCLAEKGRGRTSPNPVVGAVIVKNGKIIGQGYHEYCGGPHAEINAINSATESLEGAEIYVTLEPCSHFGKTPPCVNAIIEKKIKKVYVGTKDPNALVAGRGIDILKNANIEVETGILEPECKKINEVFFKYITEKKPFVVLKSAMSLDGKIATYTGDSRWVTGEQSRKVVHMMRNSLTGIMVGINTVLTDDPELTTRIDGGRDPIKIIVDSNLRIPLTSKVLLNKSGGRCIIGTVKSCDESKEKALETLGAEIIKTNSDDGRVNLKELMSSLGKMGIDSILLEGGGELNYSAIKEEIVDRVMVFIAPKIVGGRRAKTWVMGDGTEMMKDAFDLRDIEIRNVEKDILISGYPRKAVK